MRYLRAITLALMLVAWTAGTAAACLLPASQQTEEEKACCREMASQCGEQMQASHSCCPKSVKHEQSSLAARGDELRPQLAVAQLDPQAGSFALLVSLIPTDAPFGPSPPGPAPGAITILRI